MAQTLPMGDFTQRGALGNRTPKGAQIADLLAPLAGSGGNPFRDRLSNFPDIPEAAECFLSGQS